MGMIPVKHSAQCVAQRKGLGDGEVGLTLTFLGALQRRGHWSMTHTFQAGETACTFWKPQESNLPGT